MKNKPLIIITGPTAAGKTKLSIELAKKINGEIISADSMQVYRGMDIGTAKITPAEMEGIPHHLIDIIEPSEQFNVVEFQKRVKESIDIITANGHIPILVGGTGFYIQAVIYDVDFTEHEDDDNEVRDRLLKEVAEIGPLAMFEKLEAIDPDYAKVTHANNIKKVVRALSYYELTGERFSVYNDRQKAEKKKAYDSVYFCLTLPREKLYENIERRVDKMIEAGLVDEVRGLLSLGYDRGLTSMEGLGYKEILSYLKNECTLEEAIYNIKHGTKLFAKRQETWFRRENDVIMVDKSQYEDDNSILRFMMNKMEEILK